MGEPLKSLGDMAHRRHKYVKIKDGDLVLAVTSPSVSYETTIARIENESISWRSMKCWLQI